jgi:hypothetical protein
LAGGAPDSAVALLKPPARYLPPAALMVGTVPGSRYFQRVLPQVRLLPRGKGEAVTGLRLPWNGRVSPWPTRRISGAAA